MSNPSVSEEAAVISAAQDGGPDWEDREKGNFVSRQGDSIKYRRWGPKPGTKPLAMLMICHGLHEHSGRWAHVAHAYTEKGYIVFAADHVGHGMTAAARDPADAGVVDDYTKLPDNFVEFVEKMAEKEEDKTMPIFILGHSMGSLIVTAAAKGCQQSTTVGARFKKLVLSGCALVPGPSAASPFGFRFLYPLVRNDTVMRGFFSVLSWVSPKGPAAPIVTDGLSLDPHVAEENRLDPLVVQGNIRNKTAYEMLKLVQVVRQSASEVKVPTMIIHGGKDDICYPEGSQEMEKLLTSCPDKTIKIYDDLLHEVLNHKESFQVVLADLQAFWDSP